MSECYPTGCTPCNGDIQFPEKPENGQRYCKTIDANGATKCWIYDKCIPGWRAEGPSISPTEYRGVVDVCIAKPDDFNEKAGDFVIAAKSCNQANPTWGLNLGKITKGDRVAFDGVKWDSFPPPSVPYADDALDGDVPSPDSRQGGIVKLATTNQVKDGTSKCDVVTPYTLRKAGFGDLIGDGDLIHRSTNDIEFSFPTGDDDFTANKKTNTTIQADLTTTSVTPGTYVNASIQVDSKGRISDASNGVLVGALYLADVKDFAEWQGSVYNHRPGQDGPFNGDTIVNDVGTAGSPAAINPTLRGLIRNPEDITGTNEVYRGDMVIWIDPDSDQGEAGKPWLYLPRDLGVNLEYQASAVNGVINNSAGSDVTIPLASGSIAGLMSPGDKAKVDNALNLGYEPAPDEGYIIRQDNSDKLVTIPLVTSTNAGLISPTQVSRLETDFEYLGDALHGDIIRSDNKDQVVRLPLVDNTPEIMTAGLMSPTDKNALNSLTKLDALYLADSKNFSAWNGSKDSYTFRPVPDGSGQTPGPERGDVILNDTGSFSGTSKMSSGLKAKIYNDQDIRPGDVVVRGDKVIYIPDAENATETKYWLYLPTDQIAETVGKGVITISANGVEQGKFSVNQENDEDIDVTVDIPEFPDFTPTQPSQLSAVVNEGTIVTVCKNNPTLNLTCSAEAETPSGIPAITRFTYQWREVTGGPIVPLRTISSRDVAGGSSDTLTIEDFTITPDTGTRSFDCVVTSTDLFGQEISTTTLVTNVTLGQAIQIITQPADLELENNGDTGTMQVRIEQLSDTLPDIVPQYIWKINGFAIEDAAGPGNSGYTFADWATDTLTINLVSDNAINYAITCEVVSNSCSPSIASETAALRGPGGGTVAPPPSTDLNAVGSYRIFIRPTSSWAPYQLGQTYTYNPDAGVNTTTEFPQGTFWRNMGSFTSYNTGGINLGLSGYIGLFVRIS